MLNRNIQFTGVTYTRVNGNYFDLYDFRLLIILKIINEIFNDRFDFLSSLDKIKEIKENNIYIENKDSFFNILLPFLTYEQHRWEIVDEKAGVLTIGKYKIDWKLIKADSGPSRRNIYFRPEYKIFENDILVGAKDINFFFFLRKTIEIIERYDLNWYK